MGTFYVTITIRNPQTGEGEELDALVDTGSTFTSVPTSLLASLGIVPVRNLPFELADNRLVNYPVGYGEVVVSGQSVITLCIFGTDDAEPILGAVTLESLLLTVDPVRKTLVPTRGSLR